MKITPLLVLALAGATSAANAVLISGFEQTPDFWEKESGNLLPGLQYSNSVGVSQGSFSLETRVDAGYQTPIKTFDGAISPALRQGGTLEVDITIPTSGFTGTANWFEVFVAWTGELVPYANQIKPITNNGLTQTVTFQLPTVPTTQTYYGIFLGTNNGGLTAAPGGAAVYFDNIRFTPVPEPATMSVLGLGVVALLRRRRSR